MRPLFTAKSLPALRTYFSRSWYLVLVLIPIYFYIQSNWRIQNAFEATWAFLEDGQHFDKNEIRESSNVRNYPELVDTIRRKHLTPPTSRRTPYKLTNPSGRALAGEVFHKALLNILKLQNITKGFFVECGALDGEYLSETLDLEMYSKWSGLLIEGSPSKVPLLKSKKRKSWIADVCLTGDPHRKAEFITKVDQSINWKRGNGKVKPIDEKDAPENFEGTSGYKSEGFVDCFALHLVLQAVGVTSVDLLVLDVEGQEFNVLKNYPFDLLPIKVIALEHWLTKNREDLVIHLLQNKYRILYASVQDYIFVLK